MFDPMSSSPEIGFFLLLSASLDCRGFAVLISEKNLSDADLSRLKKTSLKLSVFIIALIYEYIRSSLLLTSRSSYQFHYMRLYMFKMLFVINLLFPRTIVTMVEQKTKLKSQNNYYMLTIIGHEKLGLLLQDRHGKLKIASLHRLQLFTQVIFGKL